MDGITVLMDCLWLLAGAIPGVVALVVDFSTGGVYKSGTAVGMVPGQPVTFRLRGAAPRDAQVAVTIQDPGRAPVVLFERKVLRGEEASDVQWSLPSHLDAGRHALMLTIDDRPAAGWNIDVASARQ